MQARGGSAALHNGFRLWRRQFAQTAGKRKNTKPPAAGKLLIDCPPSAHPQVNYRFGKCGLVRHHGVGSSSMTGRCLSRRDRTSPWTQSPQNSLAPGLIGRLVPSGPAPIPCSQHHCESGLGPPIPALAVECCPLAVRGIAMAEQPWPSSILRLIAVLAHLTSDRYAISYDLVARWNHQLDGL